jgi:hypothetical protein
MFDWLAQRWPLALLIPCKSLGVCRYTCRTPLINGLSEVYPHYFVTHKYNALELSAEKKSLSAMVTILVAKKLARCADMFPARMQEILQETVFRVSVQELLIHWWDETQSQGYSHVPDDLATLQTFCEAAKPLGTEPLTRKPLGTLPGATRKAVNELHDRFQRVHALQDLVVQANKAIKPLESAELQAKLDATTGLLEQQRLESQAEVERLEKELAAEKQQRAEREVQIRALQDAATDGLTADRHGLAKKTDGVATSISKETTVSPDDGRSSIGPTLASTAADVIQQIRRKRLVDIGMEDGVSADIMDGIRSIQASLSRAVERLAKDLYASDAHALHELLQNADDCSYPLDVEASIKFWLGHQNGVAFFASECNEVGLSEADVWALCDINASTKANSGLIGQKGIGWKSMFLLTDMPHVLSRGYAFKFDVAGPLGLLGYVTPTLLTEIEIQNLPEDVVAGWQKGHTIFYAPLRTPGIRLSLEAELCRLCSATESQGFPSALPMSLLFFRKLRHLTISVHNGKSLSASFSKQVLEADCRYVSLRTLATTGLGSDETSLHDFFLQATTTSDGDIKLAFLLSGQTGANAGSEGCMETAIQSDSSHGSAETELPHAWIFTFLPVRCVGFHFAVHAPFDLTASRGDLHYDSARNVRLRDSIPIAFEAAIGAETEASTRMVGSRF